MALTSLPFAIFTLITGVLYFAYPKKEQRWIILLIASCFFYVYNSFQYSVFILITILTIHSAAGRMAEISETTRRKIKANKAEWSRTERKMFRAASDRRRRRILALTLVFNFGILFIIKYFNFMSGSIASLTGAPADSVPQIHLLLQKSTQH